MEEDILHHIAGGLRALDRIHVGFIGACSRVVVGQEALQLLPLVHHQSLRSICIIGEVREILLHLKNFLGIVTLRALELYQQGVVPFTIFAGLLLILWVVLIRVIAAGTGNSKARTNACTRALIAISVRHGPSTR